MTQCRHCTNPATFWCKHEDCGYFCTAHGINHNSRILESLAHLNVDAKHAILADRMRVRVINELSTWHGMVLDVQFVTDTYVHVLCGTSTLAFLPDEVEELW